MKKLFPLLLMLLFLLCGCEQYTVREGVEFPFSFEDIVSIDAYSHPAGFAPEGRKKTVTEETQLQSIYVTFRYLELKTGPIEYTYDAEVTSYLFHLADGSPYELVYEENGVKEGILTAENMAPHFTSADINSLWYNLSVDAEGCPADEIPALIREDPAEAETAAPVQFSQEETIIEELLLSYLEAKQLDFVSEEDHSVEEFFAPLTRQNLNILPFSKVFRFEKLVRKEIVDSIKNESFDVSVNDISVSGNTASATAVEVYTYLLEEAEGMESVRCTTLTFSLIKTDGEWKINYIETDNEDIEGLIEGIGDVDAYFRK